MAYIIKFVNLVYKIVFYFNNRINMFGQSYMRYEIFPKLNGPVIEKIID